MNVRRLNDILPELKNPEAKPSVDKRVTVLETTVEDLKRRLARLEKWEHQE